MDIYIYKKLPQFSIGVGSGTWPYPKDIGDRLGKPSLPHDSGQGLLQRIIILNRQGHTIASLETLLSMIVTYI